MATAGARKEEEKRGRAPHHELAEWGNDGVLADKRGRQVRGMDERPSTCEANGGSSVRPLRRLARLSGICGAKLAWEKRSGVAASEWRQVALC